MTLRHLSRLERVKLHSQSYEPIVSQIFPRLDLRPIRLWTELEHLTKEELEAFAQIGLNSLHFYSVFVLGYDRLSDRTGFHGRICHALETLSRPLMFLCWRGAFKTTLAQIADTLHGATKNPREYDKIISVGDLELGKQHLEAIGSQIEGNPRLRKLYPWMEVSVKQWKGSSKRLASRSPSRVGPTWEVRSTKQKLTGRHRQVFGIDDWVDDQNYTSRDEQDRLKRKLEINWSTLDTDRLIITATLYADYDFNNYLIEQLFPDELDLFIQPVRGYSTVSETGKITYHDDGVYPFPEEWNDERYDRQRRKYGDPYLWACQMLLDPSQKGELGFKCDHISYSAHGERPPMSIYIAGDPASGTGTSHAAVAVVGVTAEKEIHILAVQSDFKSEAEFVDGFFMAVQVWQPKRTGIERYGQGGHGTEQLIRHKMQETNKWFALEPITRRGGDMNKIQHIRSTLFPLYEWRKIHHDLNLRGGAFESELASFPENRYLDELEAVSYAVELALKYGYREGATDKPEKRPGRVVPLRRSRKIGYTLAELSEYDLAERPNAKSLW